MDIFLSPSTNEAPGPAVDLGAESLKTFVEVSRAYPALGAFQAAAIAIRATELEATPETMQRELRGLPQIYDRLAAMANNAHQHVGSNMYVSPVMVDYILIRVFGLAQEMSEQMPEDEIRKIIEQHLIIQGQGVDGQAEHLSQIKQRLGIKPFMWRRNT